MLENNAGFVIGIGPAPTNDSALFDESSYLLLGRARFSNLRTDKANGGIRICFPTIWASHRFFVTDKTITRTSQASGKKKDEDNNDDQPQSSARVITYRPTVQSCSQ